MKIAVIGANGLVGSRLVEQLHLGTDHAAVPIVRGPAALARPARFDLPCRLADALDGEALRAALQGCDAVVHAARGHGREIERMPAVLCAAAGAAGLKRVVYLSNASVHGPAPDPGTNELTPLPAEHAVREAGHQAVGEENFFRHARRLRLEGIALRPGIVYGPRSWWLAGLAGELREGRAGWHGDGRGIFNGIYVDNLVSAIFSALAAPPAACGQAYLVGDGETVTWREFYVALAKLTGASPRRIGSVNGTTAVPATARSRLRQLTETPGLQAMVPAVPRSVKQLAKYMLADTPDPLDGWTPTAPATPVISRELALLQQCRWRFPHKRAARALGFQPPVSLNDALSRSAAWLAFAEAELPHNPRATFAATAGQPAGLDVRRSG